MELFMGVDIGGTETKMGLFSKEGELQEKWAFPTNLQDAGSHIIPDVAKEVREGMRRLHYKEADLKGIGLGIPGPVAKDGYVKTCVNLNWHEFHPVKELQTYFPELEVAAGNDANVAALGEYHKGAGKKYSSMMLVTLGTGVGGGIILDGKILLGAHGIAGEIGHIGTGKSKKNRCNCGNEGCVDQWASATGIANRAKELLRENSEPSLLRGKEPLTAKEICDSAKEGDKLALQCLEDCMEPLGKALAYFSHSFDPEGYVIGGGVSRAGEILIEQIKKSYEKYIYLVPEAAEIVQAELGNDAGITGACMLAITAWKEKGEKSC